MRSVEPRRRPSLLPIAAAMVVLSLGSPGQAQPERGAGPFAELEGAWSGAGSITLANGAQERIRCRAVYDVDGSGAMLRYTLRCASDSYKFELTSNVVYNGGAITGSWTEPTRNASGTLSGTVNRGDVQARVDGPTFRANLAVNTRGNRQALEIRSAGTELTGASVQMTRSGR